MDTYLLRDLHATVGMFGDFTNFKDVIDHIFETNEFKRALDIFGCDDIQDISELVTDDTGTFSEEKAQELCMSALDGVSEDDYDPKVGWYDHQADELAGR